MGKIIKIQTHMICWADQEWCSTRANAPDNCVAKHQLLRAIAHVTILVIGPNNVRVHLKVAIIHVNL